MTIFLVGLDNGNLYSEEKIWNLEDALDSANNGDTIKLIEGFSPYYEGKKDSKAIVIHKDITILGHVNQIEGVLHHTNLLNPIFIGNGANVTLKNIHIRVNKEKSNCLNIKETSCVKVENVLIENESTSGQNYPIIHISGNSDVNLNNVTITPSPNLDGKNIVFIKDSTLTASGCFLYTGVKGYSSNLNFEDVTIENTDTNGLYTTDQSTINLNSVRINGGKLSEENNFPCVRLNDSKGTFKNITIEQPNYSEALSLLNSNITITYSLVDSLSMYSSKVNIDFTEIAESLFVCNNSKIESKRIDILGRDNGKINFYANKNSSIEVDEINFGKKSSPNIRLERNVIFNVEHINFLSYDYDTNNFKTDENGAIIYIDREYDIDYFGEKSSLQRLNELIGINSIKNDVEEFIAVAQMNKLREEQGLEGSLMSLHSLFLGNPGTGKTTVARIIGEILYEENVISKDVFIEVSRADLVAEYVGQTAPKTNKVLQSALGGVLFIDEAYSLSRGGAEDFGLEAINEILSFMENHRDDIVIIFAGYTDDMNEFLKTNSGLISRIPNIFDFPDYTIDELIQIGLINIYQQKYQVNEEAYRDLVYNNYEHSYDQSNGRWIRNLNDQIIRRMAIRIMGAKNCDVTKILDEDLHTLMI